MTVNVKFYKLTRYKILIADQTDSRARKDEEDDGYDDDGSSNEDGSHDSAGDSRLIRVGGEGAYSGKGTFDNMIYNNQDSVTLHKHLSKTCKVAFDAFLSVVGF